MTGGAAPPRVGFGYDVHRLVTGRPLILAGEHIPHQYGLDGHSDADVLTHAIMDALLGAAGLGDIGGMFPDDDPAYQDAHSVLLLEQVVAVLTERGWSVGNVDATVVAEQPRLAPLIPAMRRRLAAVLAIPLDRINIKATTGEGIGFAGRREGIAAYAVCVLLPATNSHT